MEKTFCPFSCDIHSVTNAAENLQIKSRESGNPDNPAFYLPAPDWKKIEQVKYLSRFFYQTVATSLHVAPILQGLGWESLPSLFFVLTPAIEFFNMGHCGIHRRLIA